MTGTTINSYVKSTELINNYVSQSPITITSKGTIKPSAAGAYAVGVSQPNGVVFNFGLIDGGYGGAGSGGVGGNGGVGFYDKKGGITITNAGTILGGNGGNGGGSDAFGGSGGYALYLSTGDTLTNTGRIAGGSGASGEFGADGGIGVLLAGNATLVTSGTIAGGAGGGGSKGSGSAGDAVQFKGTGELIVNPGAVFSGTVLASVSNADTLVVAGSSGVVLSGIGSEYLNFKQISFAAGASRTIAGNSVGLAGGEVISGMSAGDEILLTGFYATGFYATSDTYVSGVGLEISDASSTVTLKIAGNFNANSAYDFLVTNGNDYTAIALSPPIHTISSLVNTNVTLDNQPGAPFASPLTVTSEGAIFPLDGDEAGVDITSVSGTASLVNAGIIFGGNGYFNTGDDGAGGAGVNAAQPAQITNAGYIIGGYAYDAGGNYKEADADDIGGDGGNGVNLVTGDSLFNAPVVSIAGEGHVGGIIIGGYGGYGKDRGGTGGAGVYLNGGILTNAGNIYGGGLPTYLSSKNGGVVGGKQGVSAAVGEAVLFGSVAGTLVVEDGAYFEGLVVADSKVADVLELAGSSSSALAGIGTQFENFNDISFASGAAWTIEGDSAGLAGPAISGFTVGDTIILDGFAATADHFVSGSGLEIFNGTSTETLNIAGTFSANSAYDFLVTSESGSTTIALSPLIHTISNTVAASVTLNNQPNGPFVSALTVTGTGLVEPGARGDEAGVDIAFVSGTASLVNAGRIIGAYGYYNNNNKMGGAGGVGVNVAQPALISNSGTITGGAASEQIDELSGPPGGAGVNLASGATLFNTGTITGGVGGLGGGTGGAGIYVNGGVIFNAGAISGGAAGPSFDSVPGEAGDAIQFGSLAGTLVVEKGASFSGLVVANSTVADVLDLEDTSSVILSGIGTEFVNFNDINFASGAAWSIEGNAAGLAGRAITGFTVGDTIILDNFVVNTLDTTYIAGTGLELTDTAGNKITLDLVEPAGVTTGNFVVVDPPGDTTITFVACFAEGTRILTGDGRLIAVERLAVGDAVEIFDGSASEIIWVGRRRIDVAAHPRPETVQPIRIEAGALGGGLPWRELVVSPDHGMYLDGHLIPAKILRNGETIRQLDVGQVTYYHIELARHAVLFAEGAAAESYLETGNRHAFENEAVSILHPDFAQTKREAESCAPFVEAGPVVEAVRQRILDRANIQTTQAPELKIQIRDGDAHIISRAAIPGQLQADPRDQRRLGVKIAVIRIGGETLCLAHPMLSQGWHDVEADGRWTDGHAVIPAALVTGEVTVELAAVMTYREGPALAA